MLVRDLPPILIKRCSFNRYLDHSRRSIDGQRAGEMKAPWFLNFKSTVTTTPITFQWDSTHLCARTPDMPLSLFVSQFTCISGWRNLPVLKLLLLILFDAQTKNTWALHIGGKKRSLLHRSDAVHMLQESGHEQYPPTIQLCPTPKTAQIPAFRGFQAPRPCCLYLLQARNLMEKRWLRATRHAIMC